LKLGNSWSAQRDVADSFARRAAKFFGHAPQVVWRRVFARSFAKGAASCRRAAGTNGRRRSQIGSRLRRPPDVGRDAGRHRH
jgi:hypothetical protein